MDIGYIAFVPDLLAVVVFNVFKMETVKIPETWAIWLTNTVPTPRNIIHVYIKPSCKAEVHNLYSLL